MGTVAALFFSSILQQAGECILVPGRLLSEIFRRLDRVSEDGVGVNNVPPVNNVPQGIIHGE